MQIFAQGRNWRNMRMWDRSLCANSAWLRAHSLAPAMSCRAFLHRLGLIAATKRGAASCAPIRQPL